jgi:hypothetical protein
MTISPRERHNGATTWTPQRQHTSRDADELDSDALPLTRIIPRTCNLPTSIRRTPLVKSAFLLLCFGGILNFVYTAAPTPLRRQSKNKLDVSAHAGSDAGKDTSMGGDASKPA